MVLFGLLTGRRFDGWTALFLATTVATSVTGFGTVYIVCATIALYLSVFVGVVQAFLKLQYSRRWLPTRPSRDSVRISAAVRISHA